MSNHPMAMQVRKLQCSLECSHKGIHADFTCGIVVDPSQVTISASQGIFISDGSRRDAEHIMVAALGLSIQYESLYTMFMMSTKICTDSMDCNNTQCDSPV